MPFLFLTIPLRLRYKAVMKTIFLLPLLGLALALPAQAEAYKCRQPDGRTEISNAPCAGNSSTVKAIPDDVVPEERRESAERAAERQRQISDKNDAARLAREKTEAEERERAESKQAAAYAPPASQVEECLRTVERMALEASRRSELIAGCQRTGTIQPVFSPEPYYAAPYYYGTPGYVRPSPKPHPTPQPVPPTGSQPAKPGKTDLFKVPAN